MRTWLLPLALLPLSVIAEGKLFVVVHTTDAVVNNYVCSLEDGTGEAVVVKQTMASSGHFYWHAVGGVAPYTVISPANGTMGGCVTVRDAEGNVATGCGVVGVKQVEIPFNCANEDDPATPVKRDRNKPVRTPATTEAPTPKGPVTGVTNDPVEDPPPVTNGGDGTTVRPVDRTPMPDPGTRPDPTGKKPMNRVPPHKVHGQGGSMGVQGGGITHTTTAPRAVPNTGGGGTGSGGGATTSPTIRTQ